jgi:hypothetical protein
VSNPPYVKLQNFRKVESDVADYLVAAKRADGSPLYASTQTGNFDMYLPFIEKGISLLNENGRMGFIAPNVWTVNDYGKGLRQLLAANRCLDRWVDFKSFQVFDEAITYTALQFYSKTPNAEVRCAFAPDGNVAGLHWDEPASKISYDRLSTDGSAWNFMSGTKTDLLARLKDSCSRLDECVEVIFQGIITSADSIFHLRRIGPGRYAVKNIVDSEREVEIEDALMRPLVSGPEAKRYTCPSTDTYLLFPYDVSGSKPRLYSEQEMQSRYPMGLHDLKTNEQALRARERNSFDDNQWFRFGRNQNIDKQGSQKLLVPRLVQHLFCAVDGKGEFCIDNVDVGGIIVKESADFYFLVGILNSPVPNAVWREISKPFQNDYRSANKQFIAPLPIPKASLEHKKAVGTLAQKLQELHTLRRDKVVMVEARLTSPQTTPEERRPTWLWADVRANAAEWESNAPEQLTPRERKAWAKKAYQDRMDQHVGELAGRIGVGSNFTVELDGGELRVLANGARLVSGVFVSDAEGAFIAAQWRHALRDLNVTDKFTGKRLLKLLLELRHTDNDALRKQVIQLDLEIDSLDSEIQITESELNALIYSLYGINDPAEIQMIETG